MEMIDCWKQMMFNLIVEPTREVITKKRPIAKVLGSYDLMLVKVCTRGMCTRVRQMIDLRINHEAYTEDCVRNTCPNQCFPEWKSTEWPHESNEDVHDTASYMSSHA